MNRWCPRAEDLGEVACKEFFMRVAAGDASTDCWAAAAVAVVRAALEDGLTSPDGYPPSVGSVLSHEGLGLNTIVRPRKPSGAKDGP